MSTQVASEGVAERLPAMCGRATLATEVSRTSMKVPSITETATSQALYRGCHSPASRAGPAPPLPIAGRWSSCALSLNWPVRGGKRYYGSLMDTV